MFEGAVRSYLSSLIITQIPLSIKCLQTLVIVILNHWGTWHTTCRVCIYTQLTGGSVWDTSSDWPLPSVFIAITDQNIFDCWLIRLNSRIIEAPLTKQQTWTVLVLVPSCSVVPSGLSWSWLSPQDCPGCSFSTFQVVPSPGCSLRTFQASENTDPLDKCDPGELDLNTQRYCVWERNWLISCEPNISSLSSRLLQPKRSCDTQTSWSCVCDVLCVSADQICHWSVNESAVLCLKLTDWWNVWLSIETELYWVDSVSYVNVWAS